MQKETWRLKFGLQYADQHINWSVEVLLSIKSIALKVFILDICYRNRDSSKQKHILKYPLEILSNYTQWQESVLNFHRNFILEAILRNEMAKMCHLTVVLNWSKCKFNLRVISKNVSWSVEWIESAINLLREWVVNTLQHAFVFLYLWKYLASGSLQHVLQVLSS